MTTQTAGILQQRFTTRWNQLARFLKYGRLDPTPGDPGIIGLDWDTDAGFYFVGTWVDGHCAGRAGDCGAE